MAKNEPSADTGHALTHEEYQARAALLDRLYDPQTNTLYHPSMVNDIDADTLEPVTLAEIRRRVNAYQRGNNG